MTIIHVFVIVCMVLTVGYDTALAVNDNVKNEIEETFKAHPSFTWEYSGEFIINSWPVQAVAYTTAKDYKQVSAYYRNMLSNEGMMWIEDDSVLDYLHPAQIGVLEIDVLDTDYDIYIIHTELVDRCLIVICNGIRGDLFTVGTENEGRDILDIPRYPGSKRIFSFDQSQGNEGSATYVLYETFSSINRVKEHFEAVLVKNDWMIWPYLNTIQLNLEGEIIFAFKDDAQGIIGIIPDRDREIISISVVKHSNGQGMTGGFLWGALD